MGSFRLTRRAADMRGGGGARNPFQPDKYDGPDQPDGPLRVRNPEELKRIIAGTRYWLAIFLPSDSWAKSARDADCAGALLALQRGRERVPYGGFCTWRSGKTIGLLPRA